jgi:hypothetical protein
MKVMYLDESGDHVLDKIHPNQPVFVLGGVIVDFKYAQTELEDAVVAFKDEFFSFSDIILHTADLVRNKNGFEKLKDPDFRQRFYERLNELMRKLDYVVVACAIKKELHVQKYGASAFDPYKYSLEILVERFCKELGDDGEGVIIAEKRRPDLDKDLEAAWLRLERFGTDYLQSRELRRKVVGLIMRDKKDNLSGLQLADLVVTPISRYVQGKEIKEDFRIIEQKFRRNAYGGYEGVGLVVLPK